MARPRKREPERRSAMLPRPRVTPEERRAIEQKAAACGLTLTEYQRQAALNATVIVRDSTHLVALIRQISAIGNNLNQLTRGAHVTGEADQERVRHILDDLEHLQLELMDGSEG